MIGNSRPAIAALPPSGYAKWVPGWLLSFDLLPGMLASILAALNPDLDQLGNLFGDLGHCVLLGV